jgi:hypothetical protein
MQIPKFYQNWNDDNHCLQAAMMIVLNTLDGPVSWDEVNWMTQYESGLYSWTPVATVALSKCISGSRLISGMDYKQFTERGEAYLKEYFLPEWYKLQRAHSSPGFKKEQRAAKELVGKNLVEKRGVSKEDMEELLGGLNI